MAWTDLTFAFGSTLSSTQMTQLDDNFDAFAAGDSGAPEIQTAALIAGEQMTTDNVLGATAGLTAGAVGSYVFAIIPVDSTFTNYAFGSTIAGSSLRPCGVEFTSDGVTETARLLIVSATALSGTWRCLGETEQATIGDGKSTATLWVRIS